MYDGLLKDILNFTDSSIGFIGEVQKDKKNNPYLKIYSLSNISWDDQTRRIYEDRKIQDFNFKKLNSLYGKVLLDKKNVISNNPAHDDRSFGLPKGHPALKSFFGIPIFFGDDLVGEVGIANRKGGYTEKTLEDIEAIFFALGQIIVARQDREAKIRAETELKKINETLVERIEIEVAKRLNAVEEKKKQKEMLVQQSKMAAIGEMVSAISHQWQQPLNVISLYAQEIEEVIEYTEKPENELKEIGTNIISQVEFMVQTMRDFRNFFKPSKEKYSFIASDIVQEVINMFKDQFKAQNIEINIHSNNKCIVYGYPNEFKQVVLNIINNARDVILEQEIKNGKIDCYFEQNKDYGVITIKDNGGGISKELLPDKIFDAYTTTKGENGTGIGLQISKIIVETNMEGKLWAHNIDDSAEFVIELPIKKE